MFNFLRNPKGGALIYTRKGISVDTQCIHFQHRNLIVNKLSLVVISFFVEFISAKFEVVLSKFKYERSRKLATESHRT